MSKTDPPDEPPGQSTTTTADASALQSDLTELTATHERLAARLSAADD